VNTGMMINLIESMIQSFEVVRGLVPRLLRRSGTGGPRLADATVSEYLPMGSLRSIRLSNSI